MKPTFFLCLFAAMLFSGSALAKYSGGSGTAEDPYQIGNVADLLALAVDTNDYDEYFVLTADINLDPCLPGGQVFTTAVIAPNTSSSWPFQGTAFSGVFNGAGHRILNLTIDTEGTQEYHLGLFGNNNGLIKNLRLQNASITGGSSFFTGGVAGNNSGIIDHCSSEGNIVSSPYSGGLVGSNEGNVSNCYSGGNIGCGDFSQYLGGLVGRNEIDGGSISESYSTGNVTGGNNSARLGGLVGFSYGGVSNCFAAGDVSAGSNSLNIGGLAGQTNYGYIINCYATGDVNAGSNSSSIGGLMGYGYGFSVIRSYFLNSAGPNNGYGTPLTDAQMKQQASFTGWDFVNEIVNGPNDVWAIEEGVDYPKLVWERVNLIPPGAGYEVDFADLAALANWWGRNDCAINDDCDGADIDFSGTVDIADLQTMCNYWLEGV